ncbi:MAG: hypothetical protein FK731_13325 [Asgard group archaeon]|nr:hypothetical protein [Asgard group archaeon]
MKHYEKMIVNIIDGFDEHLESEKKILLLEDCGRKCIHDRFEKLIQKANKLYKSSNDLNDFLVKFGKIYDSMQIIDDEIIIVWEKCSCPVINKIPAGKISSTFCHCSRGWVKELFEVATGKSVEVILEESITKGDSRCKVNVIFEK